MDISQLKEIAHQIRHGILEGTYNAKSGHPGGSLSVTELITYLYFEEMNIDPKNPNWDERDRFVLSKGHAAPALYTALALKGFFSRDEIKNLRKVNSILQGHPDMKRTPGIDMSTGSLGQGFSTACGMAKSAKITGKNYRVFTVLGDGEIQEGMVWEAAMFAGFHKLDNLIAIIDNNGLQIDGAVDEVCSPYPIAEKFEAFNFHVLTMDAHDFNSIEKAFTTARGLKGKPIVIIQKSIKGKGISFMENAVDWHGVATTKEEYEKAKIELRF